MPDIAPSNQYNALWIVVSMGDAIEQYACLLIKPENTLELIGQRVEG